MDLSELKQLYDFSGRTIVITGGAGILGGEMTAALAGCGATVAILARDPAKAQGLAERLKDSAGRALVVQGDVLEPESLARAAEAVQREAGPIFGLINAVGGNRPEATAGPQKSFFDLPADGLRQVVDLNLTGTILACQAFGPQLVAQGEGAILNVGSMSGIRPLTRVVAYSAAKAGLVNFTQWLAVHIAQNYSPRIRVNAIAPGFFLTDQNRFLLTDAEAGGLTPRGQTILEHTPMGRFGQPEDLVGATLWLMSPMAAFVTGVVLPVDGGFAAFGGV